MKTLLQAFRLLFFLSLLTGVVYPLVMLLLGQTLFPRQANGSLIPSDGKPEGSELLAQRFESPRYFWPRPSAANYATVPSGASNLGPTSKTLREAVAQRRARYTGLTPSIPDPANDLLTTSGSGLDPHISPLAASQQIDRVAAARAIPADRVRELVAKHTEGPQFGMFGEFRINVLVLNLALDRLH